MLELIMKIVGIVLDQVATGALSLEEAKARARESIAKVIERAALSDAETAALDAEIDALLHATAKPTMSMQIGPSHPEKVAVGALSEEPDFK